MCPFSPKIMFYMIHIITFYSFIHYGMSKRTFSQYTGGTAGAILNVLDCESRDPVLVQIRFKIVFTVILSRPLSQLEKLPVSCERVGTQY